MPKGGLPGALLQFQGLVEGSGRTSNFTATYGKDVSSDLASGNCQEIGLMGFPRSQAAGARAVDLPCAKMDGGPSPGAVSWAVSSVGRAPDF